MGGFVDVSNMSDLEVKRLCQSDPDYSTPVIPIPKRQSNINTYNFDCEKVWAASVIAHRINNGYIKDIYNVDPTKPVKQEPNRDIVAKILSGNVPISDIDIEEGRKIRRYFQALTFKLIEGKILSEFLHSAIKVATKDIVKTKFDLNVIISLPNSYYRMKTADLVENKIKWARGGFIGNIGDKTTQTIEVIKQLWSQNYNTYYFTGINDKDQVLFFAYRTNIEIGTYVTIQGKVKSHRDNSTQISFVKVVK